MFKINLTQLKSALVSGVLTAILAGIGYIVGLGDIFAIDVHALVNVIALSFGTAIVSLIKALLTDNDGAFVGAIEVSKP